MVQEHFTGVLEPFRYSILGPMASDVPRYGTWSNVYTLH